MSDERILDAEDLVVEFNSDAGHVRALDGVSLFVHRGETLGVVGESGCGKSVTALSIMRLIPSPPGQLVSGRIQFAGEDLLAKSPSDMRKVRGNRISMIFQEPMTSLNPVFTVGDQIGESVRLHKGATKKEAERRAVEMLGKVGIPAPEERVKNYPHELSGGMRQRVMIAIALACEPELLIADEPTTALDVTIQAQILDLLKSLQQESGMSVILITHDLGVVAETCDRVQVMYAGRVVERTDTVSLFKTPYHPYTDGLLRSVPGFPHKEPIVGKDGRPRLFTIEGMVPNLDQLPPGCRFQGRCHARTDICERDDPALGGEPVHRFACHNPLGEGRPAPTTEQT